MANQSSTTTRKKKSQRRDEILQALARMLENQEVKITTASLAKNVGVSEAALYRHFPGKAKMYEGLIEFIEDSLFTRINMILQQHQSTLMRCDQLLTLLLGFAEHNPGLCRLLTGDALVGEDEELRNRITRLFDRIESQIKQVLRETEIREGKKVALSTTAAASMLLAIVEGRIVQYVRSGFKRPPTQEWPVQWQHLAEGLVV
ncbi:nucleoid occlusion factor SlmA [Marinospirillum perlucidum]|uniref:nucleoid occlusion factor SlmA n=1 Tax=Marinospirillum perlucidum TaxID=1982602 RepID=UPI000DF3A0CC|nr:nucleoid occlusion factor SlmA [Marinospirillum perlucidum]